MGKTAVVIGGTGVVGRELVDQLASAGHVEKVVNLTRRPVEPCAEKVINEVIDFTDLPRHQDLFSGDLFFSCLGTTVKQAGSIEAQRQVDLHYQYHCAKLACEQGVQHYYLVSSSGANRRSPFAYPKMKGELEHQVKQLPFESVTIFQPSLLLGHREDKRLGEEIAAKILPTLCKLPGLAKARPITGAQVAEKIVAESAQTSAGVRVFALDELFHV